MKYILMNPGPSNVTDSVRNALVQQDLCHREKEFFDVMKATREKLLKVANADESYATVIFSGSGTASVEACISSVVPERKKILIIDNGVYGDRMKKIVDAHNIGNVVLKYNWGEMPDLLEMKKAMDDVEITHVAMVHHETTTGILNPVQEVGALCRKYEKVFVVDAMSSFAGEKLDILNDNIDFCISSSNKCIQGMPGLSFVIGKREEIEKSKDNARTVYLNLYNQYIAEENNNTPFTPAIPAFFALDKALDELLEEGVENRIERYASNAKILRKGMLNLGFKYMLPEANMSNILTTFLLPKGLIYEDLHDKLKERGFIIYAGQGNLKDYAFRLSNMGNMQIEDITNFLNIMKEVLEDLGINEVKY